MTDLISEIQSVIGAPPAGCEPLQYIIAGALLLLICMSAINMVSGLLRWIGGV